MKLRSVLNPTASDFHITYDLDGDNVGEEWILHGLEIEDFPEPVALHITKHLADKILIERNTPAGVWFDEHEALSKEILQEEANTNWEDEFA